MNELLQRVVEDWDWLSFFVGLIISQLIALIIFDLVQDH